MTPVCLLKMTPELRECFLKIIVELLKEKDLLLEKDKKQIDAIDNAISHISFCLMNY